MYVFEASLFLVNFDIEKKQNIIPACLQAYGSVCNSWSLTPASADSRDMYSRFDYEVMVEDLTYVKNLQMIHIYKLAQYAILMRLEY